MSGDTREWAEKDFTEESEIEIVSDKAKGADNLGEIYTIENGFPIKRFPTDWNTHGKAAGPIRNKQMAEYADVLIAFYYGKAKVLLI